MALNFNQGALTALRGRQFADLKPDSKKVLDMVEGSIKQQKDRIQKRLDTHKEMRQQIDEMSQTELWGSDYATLSAKAEYLRDPAVLDEYMSTEEGMLEYEKMVRELNDEYDVRADNYTKTHGNPNDPPTAATWEAQLQRDMTPEQNYFEEDGFEQGASSEQMQQRYDQKQAADIQEGSMTRRDGKWVYLDAAGNEVIGGKPIDPNPFNPGLTPMDVSGGTFFRKRDDGKFQDEEQVAQFVRDNFEENDKYREQALRHYAEQTKIDGGVSAVMENMDHYADNAKQMWIDEATAIFREKKKEEKPKATEGDKRRAAERSAKKERQQRFYDAITITEENRKEKQQTGTTVLPTGMTVPVEGLVDVTGTTMNIPLQGIQGTMSVTLDGEQGQMRPQMFEINEEGMYVITGVASFDDADPNRQIETRTIEVDPNDVIAMNQVMGQLDALTTRELDGVSIRKIIESPSDFGIETTVINSFDPKEY